MKIFKSIDEKFKDIGFKKVKDDKYAVTYERYNEEYKYMQVLDIPRLIKKQENARHNRRAASLESGRRPVFLIFRPP